MGNGGMRTSKQGSKAGRSKARGAKALEAEERSPVRPPLPDLNPEEAPTNLRTYGDQIRHTLEECWEWHGGHGGKRRVLEKMGKGINWFSAMLKGPGPTADALGPLLDALGEDRRAFWRRVHALDNPSEDPLAMLDGLRGRGSEPVKIRQLRSKAKRLVATGEGVDSATVLMNLEVARRLLRSDPGKAEGLAFHGVLGAQSWKTLSQGIGVFGSTFRARGRPIQAISAIRLALRLADRAGADCFVRGYLQHRASAILSDEGMNKDAQTAGCIGTATLAREGDQGLLGQGLIMQGIQLLSARSYSRASKMFEAGLSLLQDRGGDFYLAARSGLALAYCEMGDAARASGWLENVGRLAPAGLAKMWLLYTRGQLCSRLGNLDEALSFFECSRVGLSNVSPPHGALASLRQVDVLLEKHYYSEAASVARETLWLLEPFARLGEANMDLLLQVKASLARAKCRVAN